MFTGKNNELTQQKLKTIIHYEPSTGMLTWKDEKTSPAGYLHPTGYIRVQINHKKYPAHRLAFLYMEGYFPEHEVDHRNGNRADNRWNNLRHVTKSCNLQNQKIRTDNTSGFPGVVWHQKSWSVYIQINHKKVYLGGHTTPLDAALARLTFEDQCHRWTCNHRSELIKAIKTAWPEFKMNAS